MKMTPFLVAGLTACISGCVPPATDAAQNRCLVYGFKGQNALARCTETEMAQPPGKIGFGAINAAQDQCLVLGYKGNALAECTRRHAEAAASH
jgi:hypothetical protein